MSVMLFPAIQLLKIHESCGNITKHMMGDMMGLASHYHGELEM